MVTTTTTTTTNIPPPPPQPQQGVSNSIIIQRIGELEQHMADLVEENQALEENLDKQGHGIHQLETKDLSGMIRKQTVEFIDSHKIDQKIKVTMKELEILHQRMLEDNYDKGYEDHKMAYEALQKSTISDESEQFDADKAEERTKKKRASSPTGTFDSGQDPPPPPPLKHAASSVPEDVLMHEQSDFEAQDMGFDDEDSGSRHIPKMEECHKLLTNPVDKGLLRYNISRPLPLGGPPSQMKAASYPDAGLKQMVPDQMWADEEYMYDISASYGISHWTHMSILSVVKIEVFFLYEYDYMKKIVLRRADNQEYTIAESHFKDLYPSDFKDLFWTKNDVIKSKKFIFAIQKRLKLRRIFWNLERFVGGRIRDRDYRLLQRTE
ncbi:hypothetical protein Tco_0414892 [Tanacetum coccineum]